MPRLGRALGKPGRAPVRQVDESVLDGSDEKLQHAILETAAVLGPQMAGMARWGAAAIKQANRTLPTETDVKEAGPFLEAMWRFNLRMPKPGALLAYERAIRLQGYVERASRPNLLAREAALPDFASALQNASMRRNEVLTDADQHELLQDAWGDVPPAERPKLVLQWAHVVTNVRAHGFKSIGKLLPHNPLSQLLLHGLQLLLGMSFDGSIREQLEERLGSAARLHLAQIEQERLDTYYEHVVGQDGAGGQGMVVPPPPATTYLPMFDQLSLSCQLSFTYEVLQGLLCRGQPLPDDHALTWAAFNKLLLLGLLAPLEEATAAASGRKGGRNVALHAARMDKQRIAAARQEEQQCAAAGLRASIQQLRLVLHESVTQQAHIGQTALQLLAAADAAAGGSGKRQQQQQVQQVQQLVQGADLAVLSSADRDSSSVQQQQQVLLQACIAAAWPTVIQPAVFVTEPGSCLRDEIRATQLQQQLQQQQQQQQQRQDMQREQQPGLTKLLQTVQGIPSISTQQQQQQQQQIPTEQELVPRLVQLLLKQGGATSSSSSIGTCSSTDAAAATGSAENGGSVLNQPSYGVVGGSLQLQGHVSYTCNLLLLRALSDAPPTCDAAAWTLDNMVQLLHLLLDIEKMKSQAADLACSAELSCMLWGRSQQQQQQQQPPLVDDSSSSSNAAMEEQEQQQQQVHHELEASVLVPQQHYLVDSLYAILSRMRRLKEQLCPDSAGAVSSSSSSDVAAAAAVVAAQQHNNKQQQNSRSLNGTQWQQQQQGSPGSQSWNARARSRTQQRQQQQQQQNNDMDDDNTSWEQQQQAEQGAAAGAAGEGEGFWRQQALQLYRSSRPDGWRWLTQHFDDVSSTNNQPGFWGLVRYFLCFEQLNVRLRESRFGGQAARATWLAPAWEPPQDEEEVAELSAQAARMASKIQALQVAQHGYHPADMESSPLSQSVMASLLQLSCLAAELPCLLTYSNLKPAAKEAAAAACAKGSSSSRPVTPSTPNGVYPDPDLVSDDEQGAEFSSPLTSPAASAAAAAIGDEFEECLSSGSGGGFLSPTTSCDLASGIAEHSSSSSAAAAGDADTSSSSKTASGAADAAAAAAAAQWNGSPLHLSMCVALGPLFAEDQQEACLVRLMELIVQYYDDTNTAAEQLGSVLDQQLLQQQGSSSSSSSYSYRYGSSSSSSKATATAAAAEPGAADMPGSSRLLVLLMGLYHLEMRQRQQQELQQQQWLSQQQQQQQHERTSQLDSSSGCLYADQSVRLSCCDSAALCATQLSDLLWYCTLQPECTAGLSSSSSKKVCPVASELLHERMQLALKFTDADCKLLGAVDPIARSTTLLGLFTADVGPGEEPARRFTSSFECWRALSDTCDGCGTHHARSAADLMLCMGCECAVFCGSCIADDKHSPQVCRELAALHDSLLDRREARGLELCRCEICLTSRRLGLITAELRPRFSPQQQLLVPWQHLRRQQQQQRAKLSPGWLGERRPQQQQQDDTGYPDSSSCRLLLPVTVLSAQQAADLRRTPLVVCRQAEQQRQRQYQSAWRTHMRGLQVSMMEALSEYQSLRMKEEQRQQREGFAQRDGSKAAAAAAAAAAAGPTAGFFANAGARLFGAGWEAMGLGGRGQQQQQQQQRAAGAGARFGANPYQGVGLSDDKLFGLD